MVLDKIRYSAKRVKSIRPLGAEGDACAWLDWTQSSCFFPSPLKTTAVPAFSFRNVRCSSCLSHSPLLLLSFHLRDHHRRSTTEDQDRRLLPYSKSIMIKSIVCLLHMSVGS